MRCSNTVFFLTICSWIGLAFFVVCGWIALEQTLRLLEEYGPQKNRGNPALDPPPEYWFNPSTNQWEPKDSNNPGNLVPQVFQAVQYFMIGWAILIGFTSLLFLYHSIRVKKVIKNRNYKGSRTGDVSIGCASGITAYSVFLAICWFILACFAVLPLVEYRISMQRCWDLENPQYGPATLQAICVDLVQYGLVQFKETSDDGYAMVCGPGGNRSPEWGDLQGWCSEIFFAMKHSTYFVYLKTRRYERLPMAPSAGRQHSRTNSRHGDMNHTRNHPNNMMEMGEVQSYHKYPYNAPSENGVSLYNPNYETRYEDQVVKSKPVPEVLSYSRHIPDGEEQILVLDPEEYYEDGEVHYKDPSSDESHHERSPSPPSYNGHLEPSFEERRPSHRSYDTDGRRSRHRRSKYDTDDDIHTSSRQSHKPPRSHRSRRESADEIDSRTASGDEMLSTNRSSRSRRHRKKNRKHSNPRSEHVSRERDRRNASPDSDFYEKEDRRRKGSRSVY